MVFDLDETSDFIRLRCPNCGSPDPQISTEDGEYSVLFKQCGAHERRKKNGHIHVYAECRVRRTPKKKRSR